MLRHGQRHPRRQDAIVQTLRRRRRRCGTLLFKSKNILDQYMEAIELSINWRFFLIVTASVSHENRWIDRENIVEYVAR